MRRVNPDGMFKPSTYAMAVEVTNPQKMLFISGQVGMRADGSLAEGVRAQAEVAADNLKRVLADADMDVSNVAKYTVFLTTGASFEEFIAGAFSMMPQPPTAITLVYVAALTHPAMQVEIEAIAVK